MPSIGLLTWALWLAQLVPVVDLASLRSISRSDDLAATSRLFENRGVLFGAPLFSLEIVSRQNIWGQLALIPKGDF